jgi:hypothetical protein
MNDILQIQIIILVGVLMVEIGGLWMIKFSKRYPNFSNFRKIGIFFCLLGIVACLLGFMGVWVMVHQS